MTCTQDLIYGIVAAEGDNGWMEGSMLWFRWMAILAMSCFSGIPAKSFEPPKEVAAMTIAAGEGIDVVAISTSDEEDTCAVDPDCELHEELQLESYIAKKIHESGGIFTVGTMTIVVRQDSPPGSPDIVDTLARAQKFSHEPLYE